jgi:hypothetical protein
VRRLALVFLIGLVACGDGAATVGTGGPRSSPPPSDPRGAKRVEVVHRAADLRPQPFESAVPLDDTTVAIRFWGGVAPCYVVGRVDVEDRADRVVLRVFTGRDPDAGSDTVCIELAQYQEVVVTLPTPLAGLRGPNAVAGRPVVDGNLS